MKTIRVNDKEFALYLPANKIDTAVSDIARRINQDYEGKRPLFLVILNGAFVFAADLLRKTKVECDVSFVKLASYSGTESTQYVKKLIGLERDLEGRDVIIVEDIIDTGITMDYLLNHLFEMEVESASIASLLFKPGKFEKDFDIQYIGLEIPNDFIVGYGLDYDGYGRNYPDIYKIKK